MSILRAMGLSDVFEAKIKQKIHLNIINTKENYVKQNIKLWKVLKNKQKVCFYKYICRKLKNNLIKNEFFLEILMILYKAKLY